DLFPTAMHKTLRGSMDFNMRAIVAQKLLKTICEDGKGPGRVPIVEIMTFNPTVRKLILEGEDEKLPLRFRIAKKNPPRGCALAKNNGGSDSPRACTISCRGT